MRARQDYSRSRDKDHQVVNDRQRFMKGPNRPQNDSNIPNVVEIYNFSQHYNKEEIAYFIYNQLDKVKGLLKKSLNPIMRSQLIPEKNCIQLEFRTREQALNCLQLNGIYWGNRAFYMKSKLTPRDRPKLDVHNVRMRIVSNKVEESFNKLFIGNLPEMQEFEVIDMLWSIGQVKAIQNITTNKNQVQYFCEFKANERTDEYLSKLNQLKIKNRSIIAKRAALMNTSQTSKSKVRARRSMFQRDISEFYLTLDIQSYFKDKKISCVLLLKKVISNFMVKDEILRDLKREIGKVGSIVKMLDYEKNVYIEFEKVQYAQIAYLLINQRKFQGKSIDVSFYDPINFADQILM